MIGRRGPIEVAAESVGVRGEGDEQHGDGERPDVSRQAPWQERHHGQHRHQRHRKERGRDMRILPDEAELELHEDHERERERRMDDLAPGRRSGVPANERGGEDHGGRRAEDQQFPDLIRARARAHGLCESGGELGAHAHPGQDVRR